MRRLVTSDWQLTHNDRDKYRTDWAVNQLPKLIEKYKVDQLLILGDLTEQKDAHPAPLVNEIVNLFDKLTKMCSVIFLEGNHDFLHKEHPYFKFVTMLPNMAWFSIPTVYQNCLYLPHTRDYKVDWKNVDFTKNYDFIFAHNIFEGVKANGQLLSGIPRSIFPDGCVVISGDVHEPQTLDPVIYVGSPSLCDFGDQYSPRVLLLDDLAIKSIKVHGQQKRLIQFDWKEFVCTDNGANENDIVKIQVHLQMKDVSFWADIRSKIEGYAQERKWILNSVVPIVAYVQGERQKLVNSSRKSDAEYLKTFVGRSGADDKTAEVGRQLMED